MNTENEDHVSKFADLEAMGIAYDALKELASPEELVPAIKWLIDKLGVCDEIYGDE